MGDEEIPFPVFPDNPGLLMWAGDDNGNSLLWLTEGLPDEWPVMIYPRQGDGFERLELSATSFLAYAFSRRIVCSVWSEPEFFSGPRKMKFAVNEADVEYQ